MNLLPNDDTLGEAPIECGYDNPNCLGGYSSILRGDDWRLQYPSYGMPYNIPFEPYDGSSASPPGPVEISNLPAVQTQPATLTIATQTRNDAAETMDSNFVLIACAVVLGGILLLGGNKD